MNEYWATNADENVNRFCILLPFGENGKAANGLFFLHFIQYAKDAYRLHLPSTQSK